MDYKARIAQMNDRIESTDPSGPSIAGELANIAGLIVNAETESEVERDNALESLKERLEAGARGHDL